MKIHFFKYQGTGNDFIIMDNLDNRYDSLTNKQVSFLCDRRFGIGADGLMMLNKKDGFDFEMKYFNADGNIGSMCGNGSRCLVSFARHQKLIKESCNFLAYDGPHEAKINDDHTVSVKMQDVNGIQKHKGVFTLNTGSPHYISFVRDIDSINVKQDGSEIRYSKEFAENGINVNFVELQAKVEEIKVRTYERGVEDETLSCGTGVTASALVCYHNDNGYNNVIVQTKGGTLTVEFNRVAEGIFKDIWLSGPAVKVFEGTIEIM
jgi:diaminopimelate epimerase